MHAFTLDWLRRSDFGVARLADCGVRAAALSCASRVRQLDIFLVRPLRVSSGELAHLHCELVVRCKNYAQPVILHTLVVAACVVQHDVAVRLSADPLTPPPCATNCVDDKYADVVLSAGQVENTVVQPRGRRFRRQQLVVALDAMHVVEGPSCPWC